MRILFLSQRVPHPPDRGDKITTYHVLRHLAARHELVSVCFLEEERERADVRALEQLGVAVHSARLHPLWRRLASLPYLLTRQALTLPYFRSGALARAVAGEVARGVDLLLAYSSSMGQYMLPYDSLPRIQIFAELDSDKWLQYARNHSFPGSWIYGRESRTLLNFERRLAGAVDCSTVVSEVEKQLFRQHIPDAPVEVLPNGVDLEHFRPGPHGEREPHTLIFTGVMDYGANVDGVLWFHRAIWPQVRAAVRTARLLIVGSRPAPQIRALGDEAGIEVTGFVDSTLPYFDRASVAIAPLRIARGIQNKVLEAMACGLPVVATTSAFSGIQAIDGDDLLVRDEADAFVSAVIQLLQNGDQRARIGAAARARVEQSYRWDTILAGLDAMLERIAIPRTPPH